MLTKNTVAFAANVPANVPANLLRTRLSPPSPRRNGPEVNAWVTLPDGPPAIRADFVWRAQRVLLEADGHKTHRTRQAFETDRRRDQPVSAAGWRPVRTTWRQLERAPEQVVETVAALMDR